MGESGTMRGGPVLFITIASLYAVGNGELAPSPTFRTLAAAIAVLHAHWLGDPSGRSPASHLIAPFQRDTTRHQRARLNATRRVASRGASFSALAARPRPTADLFAHRGCPWTTRSRLASDALRWSLRLRMLPSSLPSSSFVLVSRVPAAALRRAHLPPHTPCNPTHGGSPWTPLPGETDEKCVRSDLVSQTSPCALKTRLTKSRRRLVFSALFGRAAAGSPSGVSRISL